MPALALANGQGPATFECDETRFFENMSLAKGLTQCILQAVYRICLHVVNEGYPGRPPLQYPRPESCAKLPSLYSS